MNSSHAGHGLVLVFMATFSCAVHAQPGQMRDPNAPHRQVQEPSVQKPDPMTPPMGADRVPAKPPPVEPAQRPPDKLPLNCQTYPDGRTECK